MSSRRLPKSRIGAGIKGIDGKARHNFGAAAVTNKKTLMENLYGSNTNTDIQIDDAGNLYAAP